MQYVWDSAREGVVDNDPAYTWLRLPTEGEWEKRPWATYLKVSYCGKDISRTNDRCVDMFTTVDRPIPAWTPYVNQPLFVLTNSKSLSEVSVGYLYSTSVETFSEVKHYTCILSNGRKDGWPLKCLKPFDPNKIGLTWDNI